MGYDADQAAVKNLVQKLPLAETVFVSGSHNYYGQEDEPLDEAAVAAAAKGLAGRYLVFSASRIPAMSCGLPLS
jgi:hypothetical protein